MMTEEFMNLCEEIFVHFHPIYGIRIVGPAMRWLRNLPKYNSKILKEELASILANRGARSLQNHYRPKSISANLALATVQDTNRRTYLAANYNRPATSK